MQLMEALFGEPVKKEFKLGNKPLVLKTLTQAEMNDVMARLPRMDLSIIELQKVPILARALVSVDNVAIEAVAEVQEAVQKKIPVIDAIEVVLGKMDTSIINLLYGFYAVLLEDVKKQREDLKSF